MDVKRKVAGVGMSVLLLAQSGAAQSTVGISDMVSNLSGIGFFEFAVPFLLMFGIVYGLITKIGIFENDRVSGVIGVTAGLFLVAAIEGVKIGGTAVSLGTNPALWLIQFFGAFSVILVGLLAVVMAAGLGGYTDESWAWGDHGKKAFFVLGGLAALTAFFGWGGQAFLKIGKAKENIPDLGLWSNTLFVSIIVIVGIIGLILWVSGEDGGDQAGETE